MAGLELVSYFLNQNQDQIIPLRPCLESDSPCDQRFLSALYNLAFSFFFSCIKSSGLLKDLINNHLLFVIDNNIIDLNKHSIFHTLLGLQSCDFARLNQRRILVNWLKVETEAPIHHLL